MAQPDAQINADPAHIERYTLDVLIRETLFAVLGESLTMDDTVTPPVSIFGIDPAAIPNVSIRHAIAAAAATQQGSFTPTILPPVEPASRSS